MKRFFKTILFLGGAAAAAHFGMKAYKRVNGTVKLSKSLPEFLSNVYGEFPKVNITRSMNYLKIKIGFPQEILDKHDDIENTVREYIDDFYPEVAKCSVEIDIHAKGEEEGEAVPETEEETKE
ncbi:MAG TPA: hypothetical protein PKL34_05695 [Candidatus Cloacimonadota bacterium]|nr:hypothetical protein [Candidatus Cloacimonadota bacterium]HOH59598.1 hypothetical protein [Candidatus Cloacimonadota bacterium]